MKKTTILMALGMLAAAPAWAGGWHGCGGHHGMGAMHGADANHDGKITREEFMAAARQRAERKFGHMDANGDGVLDVRDHEARYFDRMDTNGDGMVSRKEFRAFHQRMMQKHRAHHQKKGEDHD